MIDSSFHRYAFDDPDGLPDWFVDDEQKHHQREMPISKELMKEFRDKMKEINSRPIRKVAEAQGRKKKRASVKLEKLRKQANTLAAQEDMSSLSKVKALKKAISKQKQEGKKKLVIVASKKA